MSKRFRITISSLLATSMLLLAGCSSASLTSSSNNTTQTTNDANVKSVDADSDSQLANLTYQSGQPSYVKVNDDKAKLNASDFKYVHVNYANLDHLNRTSSPNVAYLDSRNVANDSLRVTQTIQPTGWHQKFINNEAIINRGHEIAYSLSKGISVNGTYNPSAQSGDQNNPKNLFTQTAFSNQEVQTVFETKVRNALKAGKKVIYQVQPIFNGNNLMASGVHMQALSTDKSLNFNVYLFNVQPGIKFDYSTGRSTIDNSMKVPTPAGAPHFNDNGTNNANYHRSSYGYEGERNGNMIYHHHHWIRDYLIYRGVKHFVSRHYERKGFEEARRGFGEGESHHSFFHSHHRW